MSTTEELNPLEGLGILGDADVRFMRAALSEASEAGDAGDVPVGAVVVCEGRIIGRGRNLREKLHDPTAHAEMVALTAASDHLRSWRLETCTLYVSLEPCVMCAGAIVLARIRRLVYAAADPKAGACESLYQITADARLNHRVELTAGVLEAEAGAMLKAFFAAQRAQGKK